MLHLASDIRRSPSGRAIRFCLLTVFGLACAAFAGAQTLATYDFESGTQGWQSFAGATTPAQSNAAAYTGSNSLLTTTGSGGSGGPSISMNGILQPGGTYSITGWVRLTSGEAASNANFTVKRSDPSCSGGACYDTIGSYQVGVNGSGWAQIGGTYTPATTATGFLLYSQLVGATSAQSFYLDDVVITQIAPPPGGTPVASYMFSDGGTDGWTPFGSATLSNAVSPIADPMGNANSLLTSNRTATYMGPSLNLLGVNNLAAGATYQVSAYVMLAAADASSPTVTMSSKMADCATAGAYSNLATSGPLSNTAWTKVTGTFSFSDQPGAPTTLVLYFQSTSATDSFYISGVQIGELTPPPPDPSQQDNSGITSTFEDGGADGWGSRSGASSVTNSTAAAHSGAHSLLVTGRIANWDGPVISVSNKMYGGSKYNLSVWVMLTPADGTTHTINMSLQTAVNGTTNYPGITSYPGVPVAADGAWHQISVQGYNMADYDPGTAKLYLQTVPASGNDLVSFYVDDFQLTYVNPPTIQTDIPSIYQTLSRYFPVGAEIDMNDLTGPHEQLLTKHFDSITSGNDMKWSVTEPSQGSFDFANADSEVGLATCHNMQVRGQNLVWATGQQTPSYATGDGTNSSANQATVIANIQEHIKSEVQHFGTKVYVWDVVNEPIDPSQPDCLAHGPFYKVLGEQYLDVALKAARQYAPAGTKLFINDYSTTDPNKLACLVKVIGDLKSRGVPLDGIGHEMHNAINYPSPAMMENAIRTIAENFPDLDQQVTELDLSVYNAGDTKSNYGNNVPPAVLAEQGWLYESYFDLFRRYRRHLSDVTLWGMADDDTWLDGFPVSRTDYPLPFDMNLQAKPAYWGIVDETKLPGYGLHFTMSIGHGTRDTHTLTLTAMNGDAGTAYTTQINGFSLKQIWGRPCSAQITAPGSYPLALGDLPVNGTASATFTVSTKGCSEDSRWLVTAPWSSATYETGTFRQITDFRRGWDHD